MRIEFNKVAYLLGFVLIVSTIVASITYNQNYNINGIKSKEICGTGTIYDYTTISQDDTITATTTFTMDSEAEEEPNPPHWPDTVILVRENDNDIIRSKIMAKIKETEDGYDNETKTYTTLHHFSDRRWAILFAPGVYRNIDFEVGYYVQVAGLGKSPHDVVFDDCDKGPHVPALDRDIGEGHGCSLNTFWRMAENFSTRAKEGMKWAVSQAAPLRRVHVAKDLYLHDGAAYSSGGHLANCIIDGHTYFGSQQQFLSRNVHFQGGTSGGAWSLVFVGCSGTVPEHFPGSEGSASVTVTEKPHVRIEKPYISLQNVDDGEKFYLHVPLVTKDERLVKGATNNNLDEEFPQEEVRDFVNVRVVNASVSDPTSRIQEALDEGKDVVLAPGVFHLRHTIQIRKDSQVLLGLGLATLVSPQDQTPCVQILPGIKGVRVAGIMLEASKPTRDDFSLHNNANETSSALLEWGQEGVVDTGSPENPGSMFDIFCRVGGSGNHEEREAISVSSMMKIHSGNVVGDNIWLWRADHSELGPGEAPNYPDISQTFHQTEANENRVDNGIVVNGNDVTVFGLAVEHALRHQTIWNGERGCVHFYQSEFPYDVYEDFSSKGYRGYLVAESVKDHKLFGPGIYSNFRNTVVGVETAIAHPVSDSIRCTHPFTVHLDNHGTIQSVLNGKGGAAVDQGKPVRLNEMKM